MTEELKKSFMNAGSKDELRKLMESNQNILTEDLLELIAGGQVSNLLKPGGSLDAVINSDGYDNFVNWIWSKTHTPYPRTRPVKNDVDIYDCKI